MLQSIVTRNFINCNNFVAIMYYTKDSIDTLQNILLRGDNISVKQFEILGTINCFTISKINNENFGPKLNKIKT